MKPYPCLTTFDKAEILHKLFPTEIPNLLLQMMKYCHAIRQNGDMLPQGWSRKDISREDWLQLHQDIAERIWEYRHDMRSLPSAFASILFSNRWGNISVGILLNYVAKHVHPNTKFTEAVHFLFKKLS